MRLGSTRSRESRASAYPAICAPCPQSQLAHMCRYGRVKRLSARLSFGVFDLGSACLANRLTPWAVWNDSSACSGTTITGRVGDPSHNNGSGGTTGDTLPADRAD